MTVENIHVTDADSLDAAADLLDLRESYGDYCQRMADELAAENGVDPDDARDDARCAFDPDRTDGLYLLVTVPPDTDPEPPSPAASALRVVPQTVPCTLCRGYGVYRKYPAVCWLCGGSGEDRFADPAEIAANDRTERMRRLGQSGGLTTFDRYGRTHYRTIGKAGYAATVARHGEQYARDILRAKGWTPRTPDLISDLRAGRALADLAKAA